MRALTPGTGQEAIERGERPIVAAMDFGPDVDFGFEFEGRLEEVLEVEEFFGVEII